MQFFWNNRKFLHEKRDQYHWAYNNFLVHQKYHHSLFFTSIWPPWRHVKRFLTPPGFWSLFFAIWLGFFLQKPWHKLCPKQVKQNVGKDCLSRFHGRSFFSLCKTSWWEIGPTCVIALSFLLVVLFFFFIWIALTTLIFPILPRLVAWTITDKVVPI